MPQLNSATTEASASVEANSSKWARRLDQLIAALMHPTVLVFLIPLAGTTVKALSTSLLYGVPLFVNAKVTNADKTQDALSAENPLTAVK